MRNISDTIARLAASKARLAGGQAASATDRLSDLSGFGSNPGALRARTYIPEGLRKGAPLVVVLHGCTQTAAAYDRGSGWSELADRHGFALLFLEQQRANNANLCFNWFVPGDTQRDSGEVLSVRQMVEALVPRHGLDRSKIFVTGLSAGGAMTAAMLATYPDVFAGGAIIAGLAYGSAKTVPEAFDRMRGHGGPAGAELQKLVRDASKHTGPWPTVSIWQGTADRTVAPSNATALVEQWRGVHGAIRARTETVDGHPRQVWHDRDGREVIEVYSIAGMGHATPLRTQGPDGLGASGPYMVDVGISSTLHIARFWGLTAAKAAAKPKAAAETAKILEGEILRPGLGAKPERPAAAAPKTSEPSMPAGNRVGKIIEDALRAAGLMK